MTSIFYKHPALYNLFLKLMHGNNLTRRYNLVSKEIGKNKKVFELACGSCLIKDYLDPSCKYEGWDLNKKFVEDAKNRGLNVKLKNIFDYEDYPKSDVTLIIDVLHHITPKHDKFLVEVLKRSRKLIVIEPVFKDNFIYKIGFLSKGDHDGINPASNISKWYSNENKLRDFFRKKGAKKIEKIGLDLIVVF